MSHSKIRIFNHKEAQKAQEAQKLITSWGKARYWTYKSLEVFFVPFVALFDYREHVTRVNRIARFDVNRNNYSRTRRLHLVLHLHRLDNHDPRTLFHTGPNVDLHLHNFPRHRRRDLRHSVGVTMSVLPAAQSLRIDDLYNVIASVQTYFKTFSRFAHVALMQFRFAKE